MENFILYDALSFTSRIHSVADIVDLLGLSEVPWQTVHGAKGFQYRQYFECVSIHHCRDDNIIWVEMTGQGCRAFETYGTGDYEELFQLILDNHGDMNLTRLDVAFDDHSGLLDITTICEDTRNQIFVSRFNEWQVIEGSKGSSVTHGSHKSELFIRIYDKAAERGLVDGSHWIRVEIQLRRERALRFILSEGDIGSRFSGALINYLRYLEPSGDSNKWRWPLAGYWSALLCDANKISLYEKPGTEYNMERLRSYVFNQAGNAIDAAIEIMGIERFCIELKARDIRPNVKYQQIVEESRCGYAGERGS